MSEMLFSAEGDFALAVWCSPSVSLPMSQDNPHAAESWLKIAEQAKKETDPQKLIEVIQRLCEALEQIRLERAGNLPNKAAAA